MPVTLTADQRALLEGKNFAYVANVGPDGGPQVTPVWIDYDGAHVIFNTEMKRAKVRNLKQDPRVSISIADASNPYKYMELRGRVVEMTTDGARAHIDRLAHKYMGKDYPFMQPGDERVMVKVEVEKVLGMQG